MPKPVVVRVANCKSVSARPIVARAIYVRALTHAGPYGKPHVVLANECADFDAELLAERHGYDAAQYTRNTATAGSVVAWDENHARELERPRLLLGSPEGEGIQARHIVQVKLDVNGHRNYFSSGHAPPDRAPIGQATFLDRIRRHRGILGADFNQRRDEMSGRYRRTYHGVELLGILVPRTIPTRPIRAIDIGSDHPAVDIVLWADTNKRRK